MKGATARGVGLLWDVATSPGRCLKLCTDTKIPKVDFALRSIVNFCQRFVFEVLTRNNESSSNPKFGQFPGDGGCIGREPLERLLLSHQVQTLGFQGREFI